MAREKIFRFKQFSITNDLSAMKVGTDGVLLGAWANVEKSKKVLDVGTGTGLIALMIAQRCAAKIDAIEIDSVAAREAHNNFLESPWNDRLNIIEGDFSNIDNLNLDKYDTIVSNPPYFINSLKSPDEQRSTARHCSSLSYEKLLKNSSKILCGGGHIYLITPYDVEISLNQLIKEIYLFVCNKIYVKPTPDSHPKRILWDISNVKSKYDYGSIIIEKARHIYTDDYIALTKDYYLNM